jgi:hypothetical protein
MLNLDTPIVLLDTRPSRPRSLSQILPPPIFASQKLQQQLQAQPRPQAANNIVPPTQSQPATIRWAPVLDHGHSVKTYGDSVFTSLYDARPVDFSFIDNKSTSTVADPLSDSHYEAAHRKAERLERSIRNTEKGRAQHEKDQIIRLLGELQGHDWLRTMGVSGVTESRKKTFEPAREHFIRGCEAILEKFRQWSQEEKRRKVEKERALAEAAEQDEDEYDETEALEDEDVEEEDENEDEGNEAEEEDLAEPSNSEVMEDAPDGGEESDGDPPDLSDVDASIAKQLHEEAQARAKFAPSVSSKRSRGDPTPPAPDIYVPQREIKSFFEKRHEREAALKPIRRSRRQAVLAWGHQVPETDQGDFELPEEFRDSETLTSRERRKRRDRRGSRH